MADLKIKPTIKKDQQKEKNKIPTLHCILCDKEVRPSSCAIFCQKSPCRRAVCDSCMENDDGLEIRACVGCQKQLCLECNEWANCSCCITDINYCEDCDGRELFACTECEDNSICKSCYTSISQKVKKYNGECHKCILSVIEAEKTERQDGDHKEGPEEEEEEDDEDDDSDSEE